MTKSELLERLRFIKEPTQQLFNIRKEYWEYKRPYFDVKALPKLVKFILGFLLFQALSLPFVLLSFIFSKMEMIMATLTVIGVPVLIYITYRMYILIEDKIISVQLGKKERIHSVRMDAIVSEEKNLIQLLEDSGMPMNYCFPLAINSFETYLVNHRADNLKECINLFEQEQHNREYMNKLNTIQQIQEATFQEANSAKTMALLSIFTRR